jgi:hypothetical protein
LLDSGFANVAVKKSRGGASHAVVGDALARYVEYAMELYRPDVQAQQRMPLRFAMKFHPHVEDLHGWL